MSADTTKQMKATGRDTPWKVQHIGDSLEIIDALRDTVLTLEASQDNAALAAFIVSAVNAQSNTRAALEEAREHFTFIVAYAKCARPGNFDDMALRVERQATFARSQIDAALNPDGEK